MPEQQQESATIPPQLGRSLFRVKIACLTLVFLGCGVGLRLGSGHDNVLIAVAGLSAVLFYFVRCESCKSSIYYRKGGERKFLFGTGSVAFLLARQCPCCGLERL